MSIGIFSNSGNDVKLLKDQLDLNGTAKVLTGTSDPRSSAKDAPQGSLYLQTGATGGKLFKKLDAGSSTNWTEVGSGAGGINYILNPDGEAGTTGWAAYADAAGATPVDGTGGSPTVTFTTTSSSPLRGNNSFLITKDSANRQGEGASYAFSIDSADKSSVMAIEFDYAIASGTFAAGDSSDIRVFVYDVTNSQLITPVGNTIQSNTQSKFKGVFQTASNSTSYRLILHCSTTSASAYTFKLDNVRVGPQTVVYGSPVTDWVAYTPSWTGSTADPVIGNGSILGVWRRVGDSVQVRGYIVWGTTTSNGTGAHMFGLPSGLSIDTNKLVGATTQNYSLGKGTYHDTGVAIYPMDVFYFGTNTNVRLSFHGTSGATVVDSGAFSDSSGGTNDDELFWEFTVPIAGWGSTVQVSNDADTRVVAARASGAISSTTSGNILVFPTSDFDTHAAYSTSTGRFTCPVSGLYRVTTYIVFATGGVDFAVYQNGSVVKTIGVSDGASGKENSSLLLKAVAGDLLDLRPLGTTGAVDAASWICFERVTGPSAIAANELVAAVYTRTTTQSIPNGTDTIVDFDVKQVDTHGAVTTGASWKFTVPVAGTYSISVSVGFATNTTGARYALIRKNGSFSARGGDSKMGVTGVDTMMNFTVLERLVPGDYIDVNVLQSSGGALNTSSTLTFPAISIHRVGF